MSNIKEIEVNGQTYGLESVNDIHVSYTAPSGANIPGVWLKPAGLYDLQSTIGLERKTNSTSSYGDYTLDETGNLVETTDTSSATGTRCTKMFGLFREKWYALENVTYGSWSTGTGQLWTWDIFFYDVNKEFISKSSGQLEDNTRYTTGTKVLRFEMPSTARYIRVRFPYDKPYYFQVVDEEANIELSGGSMYGGSNYVDHIYMLDDDHYVMV